MEKQSEDHAIGQSDSETRICGIVRPIAEIGDYPSTHWTEVHAILADAARLAGYRARLVSESDAVGVILSEIVTNLYDDPIVVCDVSGRNPNVMFELGMRLAFERPAVIVTDDSTAFTFDISPVKHVIYPRSLRFAAVVEFKEKLAAAIVATMEAAALPGHRGYLQQFGPIKITELGVQQVEMQTLARDVADIRRGLQALAASSIDRRPRESPQSTLVEDIRAGLRQSGPLRFIVPTAMVPSIREKLESSRIVASVSATEAPRDGNRTFLEVNLRREFMNVMYDTRSEIDFLVREGAGILRDGVTPY